MNAANVLDGHDQRLLQIGVALLLFASIEGFVIPSLAAPRMGLSAHTLSALQAVLLLALGCDWPRLTLRATTSVSATSETLRRTRCRSWFGWLSGTISVTGFIHAA